MALSDEKREQIKALLATGAAKNDVAKKCKVSWATVDSISKEEPDKIESFREQKRMQFVDRLWNSMDKALGLADKRIELALEASEKLDAIYDKIGESELDFKQKQELQNAINNLSTIPLGQISTFIGTIYDKRALMMGENTENVGVNGEVKQTHEYRIEQQITTDPETAEILRQLYKRQTASSS
ncbi:hypothetical protein [Paenibacillus rigui]|uniref:Uncharacterized protein n=1 Tax=Paenibacillus rigui TaxID=554312 RepID=A0A229UKZ3_9BACL|nr:hypothetical protein [Paenibacillus rigui]OXM83974.1 hypothetical protein CF651_22955 [Paenibacillus rigui]